MGGESKKISCALIGTGKFGKHYVRLLQDNQRATLSALMSPSLHAGQFKLPADTAVYTDTKSVLADPNIDAVVIATPLSTHAEIAIAALRAGKHVLLEKPLAPSLDEAKKIESAVSTSGKVFMLAHQYLYNDDIAALKHELDAGLIGAVRYIHAEQLYCGPLRSDVGCFREAATHEIAIIDYMFAPGIPVSVQASAVDFSGGLREDFASATMRYSNGLFVHIVVSAYAPVKSRRMLFGGNDGMALFDDRVPEHKVQFTLRPFPESAKLAQTKSLIIPEGVTRIPNIAERKEPLLREINHFFDCIETGMTPRSDIAHAMRVEHVLDLATRAMTDA